MPAPARRCQIEIANRQRGYRVNGKRLAEVARAVLRSEGVSSGRIEIATVGDGEMTALNGRFLGRDGPTDVLAFDLTDADGPMDGQVVVSTDTARRNAAARGHSTLAELALCVTHGILHLLGYRDGRAADRQKMNARQAELLSQVGIRLSE